MKNNTRILTTIALVLQMLTVLVSFIVIIMQKRLMPIFVMASLDEGFANVIKTDKYLRA